MGGMSYRQVRGVVLNLSTKYCLSSDHSAGETVGEEVLLLDMDTGEIVVSYTHCPPVRGPD